MDYKQLVILCIICISYIFTTASSNISQKIAIDQFTEDYSFYVIQVMNVSYVILGAIMIVPMLLLKLFKSNELHFSQWSYLVIGAVDSAGILLQGIGNQYMIRKKYLPCNYSPITFSELDEYRSKILILSNK